MTWISPSIGLIFGAIALPLLLLFYFLRLRRHPLRISSTMLWEGAVEDLHANTPFQRLRPSTLLMLQLLALILVVLAVMQPQIEGTIPQHGKHVILIDRSSSMNATDGDDETRLDIAKEQAIDLVDQLHGGGLFAGDGGETMVIVFSDSANIITPFTDSKQQLTQSIQSITPTHGISQIEDALKLARAYTTNVDPEQEGIAASDAAKLELFSDGNITDLDSQALQRGESIHYHVIGETESQNVGIQTLSIKRTSESSDEVQLFLSLLNSSSDVISTDVTISVDGVPLSVQNVDVSPSLTKEDELETTNVVFVPFSLPQGGIVHATLSYEDQYAVDNSSSLIVPPPRELRVLLGEDIAPLLETVLEGMQLKSLKSVSTQHVISTLLDHPNEYDVVVTRGATLGELPQGRYIIFGSPPPVDAFSTFIKGDQQLMLVADERHPVMRYVRYEDILVSGGYHIITDQRIDTLLEGSGWPAVTYYRGDKHEIVYIGFDPIESNWPYLRSFPFFVYNAVQFLGRKGDALISMPREVGQSLTQPIPTGIESVELREPNGDSSEIYISEDGVLNWGPIRYSGLHHIKAGDTQFKIVVNHPWKESKLGSKQQIEIGANSITSSSNSVRSYIALWPWALGSVLLVLLLEWWVYQKKVTGSRTRSLAFFGDK